MHGTIFAELQRYVEGRHGSETWQKLLAQSGVERTGFDPLAEYPDSDAMALVSTASRMAGAAVGVILEDFGEFIAPDLIRMYWSLVPDEWRTLDLIEHTEETIHKLVRLNNPGARPPQLRARRVSPDEIELVYSSERKMFALARGVANGVAKHYQERITVEDRACMLRGDPQCLMVIRKVS